MKFVTLEKVLDVLEHEKNQVVVSKALREKALAQLEKMLELAK